MDSSLARRRPASPTSRIILTIRRRLLGLVGAGVVSVAILAGVLAPWIAPHDPLQQDIAHLLEGPSGAHLLGRDDLGRDVLSRLIAGAQVSLQVAIVSVMVALILGTIIGLASGYYSGWLDEAAMRLMDTIYAFPTLILAIALVAALGPNLVNSMVAISIVALPRFARLARGQVLSVREREFIQAARVAGAGDVRILARHILPNVLGVLAVQAALTVAFAILTESNLSFLGMSARPPTPTWGSMLRFGYPFLEVAPWLAIAPGAAITVVVLGFSLLGDGIRDWLDPKSRR
jgi:ABC-type dipeptide/oligopeptide/nickel transport system permease subunit